MIKNLRAELIKINKSEKIRVAIIQSTYHEQLNRNMNDYCKEVLIQNGLKEENISTYYAPGSWEIPLIAKRAFEILDFDAIVTFGIIVKGQTYHFDMIANEVGRALMNLSLEYMKPIALEVLAVNTEQQAIDRASRNNKNKGIEAANGILKYFRTIEEVKVE